MDILVMATRNRHKTGEIQSILGNSFRYLALTDVPGAPEVVEDAGTFAGNATKKAVALAKWLTASAAANSRDHRRRPGCWLTIRASKSTR